MKAGPEWRPYQTHRGGFSGSPAPSCMGRFAQRSRKRSGAVALRLKELWRCNCGGVRRGIHYRIYHLFLLLSLSVCLLCFSSTVYKVGHRNRYKILGTFFTCNSNLTTTGEPHVEEAYQSNQNKHGTEWHWRQPGALLSFSKTVASVGLH